MITNKSRRIERHITKAILQDLPADGYQVVKGAASMADKSWQDKFEDLIPLKRRPQIFS